MEDSNLAEKNRWDTEAIAANFARYYSQGEYRRKMLQLAAEQAGTLSTAGLYLFS